MEKEKMMDDLISRQAAIKAIDDLPNCHNGYSDTYDKACIIGELEELPSAQPDMKEICGECDAWNQYKNKQPERWIPCSERLPDIKEHYVSEPCIVYCSNGAYGFTELEENIFGQVGWNCERDDDYHEQLGEVIAWMPLPEPWRGEEHVPDE